MLKDTEWVATDIELFVNEQFINRSTKVNSPIGWWNNIKILGI